MPNKVEIKPPFQYFGGKSRIADLVWTRFGDVPNYCEPFAGSLAVLLKRPHWPWIDNRIETVNDIDAFLSNFWRATKHDPEAVATWCDWPVNEVDLHARHFWLINTAREQVEKMKTDPDYYDAKVAGWWCWGLCQWIGSGWCHRLANQRPHLGGGRGVHRPTQKRPHLSNAGRGVHRLAHQHSDSNDVYNLFNLLADRLQNVRVCCGDWSRILGPSPTYTLGTTAIFLDPPYTLEADRKENLYTEDDLEVGHKAQQWAVENGPNKLLRIAFCGYEGEYTFPDGWECISWKTQGGYGSQSNIRGRKNSNRERVWFSPHCLKPKVKQKGLLF